MKTLLLLPFFAFFIGLYLLSKDRAAGYARAVDRYGLKMPFLAPLGLYLLDLLPGRLALGDRKVRSALIELYGPREVDLFAKVHVAQKLALGVVVVFGFGFVALAGKVDSTFPVFGLVVLVLLHFWVDRELHHKLEQKKRGILLDLPTFINTLTLLVGAGLPFSQAVQKIVQDADTSRPLYQELSLTLSEIRSGKSMGQAYEDFAQRCKLPETTRFVSMLLQNLNRGSRDMVYVLRLLAQESWQKRKDLARKQGEEASSKMVFPMVLVFVAVAIIVLAPAIITMSR